MFPNQVIKSAMFGGFEKNSAEACLQNTIAVLNQLELQAGLPQTELDYSALKKTKFGSGYDKQSVLNCLDLLNQKISNLQ